MILIEINCGYYIFDFNPLFGKNNGVTYSIDIAKFQVVLYIVGFIHYKLCYVQKARAMSPHFKRFDEALLIIIFFVCGFSTKTSKEVFLQGVV